MAEIRVTLSANAGISVEIGDYRIWVDALHNEKQPGFSAVTPQLHQMLLQSEVFAAPDYICVTHLHPDHYSEEMLCDAQKRWSDAKLCLPGQNAYQIVDGDLKLEFIRLPHEGAQYADVAHYGIMISLGDRTVLIPGDCETASPALAEAVEGREIDLAVLNFPWVTLSRGRQFLSQILKPKHILLCHLPFAADDENGFRASALRSVRQYGENGDIRLLLEPLQTETVNI